MHVHLDTHPMLDIDQQIDAGLFVQFLNQRKRRVSDSGRINECERERVWIDGNVIDCFGTVPAPDFAKIRLRVRSKPGLKSLR